MAARRAFEWIGTSKAQLVFRYEISDLFHHSFRFNWEILNVISLQNVKNVGSQVHIHVSLLVQMSLLVVHCNIVEEAALLI